MKIMPLGRQDAYPREFGGAAFLISEGDQLFLVDCPPNINLMLYEARFTAMDLTGIFITHLHNDHVGGLVELIQFRTLAMNNPNIWRNAGYFDKIVCEKIEIFVLGHDEKWLDLILKLISFNCNESWGEYQEFVILKSDYIEKFGFNIEVKQGVHSVKSFGIKFDNKISISGDTEYNDEFEDWLCLNSKLVFHEAGYGGAHCGPNDLPKIIKRIDERHQLGFCEVFFYHIPFAAIDWMQEMNYPIVEKKWYEV